MRKIDETMQRMSYFNRALPAELMFVLLGRDEDAPATIEFWVQRRIAHGKNLATDKQILEALGLAKVMRSEHQRIRGELKDEGTSR